MATNDAPKLTLGVSLLAPGSVHIEMEMAGLLELQMKLAQGIFPVIQVNDSSRTAMPRATTHLALDQNGCYLAKRHRPHE